MKAYTSYSASERTVTANGVPVDLKVFRIETDDGPVFNVCARGAYGGVGVDFDLTDEGAGTLMDLLAMARLAVPVQVETLPLEVAA